MDDVAAGASEPRLEAWERRSELPLTVLSISFLAGYALEVLATTPGSGPYTFLDTLLWVIWGIFVVDYAVRLVLARDRWRFVRHNLLDLLVVLAPFFRFLRLLRLVGAVSTLNRRLRVGFRGRVGVYVTTATSLISLVAALAVYEAERGAPESEINTFGDAMWWVLTTITTVGYGDTYPVTVQGRLVAAALMLAGIALLGTVTATIATWFTERLDDRAERLADRAGGDVRGDPAPSRGGPGPGDREGAGATGTDEVLAEIRALHARLERLENALGSRSGPPPAR